MDISAAKKAKQYDMWAGARMGANPLGQLIFVDTTNGSNTNDGHDPRRALATLAQAKIVAETNDTIIMVDSGRVTALRVNSGPAYAAPHLEMPGANYLSVEANMSTSTSQWSLSSTSHEVLAVSGLCRIWLLPEVTASVGNDDGNSLLTLGTETTASGFLAATTANMLDTGEFWISATGGSNVGNVAKSSIIDQVVNDVDIGYAIATTGTTAGTIKFHCWWLPLEDNAFVAAGTGGGLN